MSNTIDLVTVISSLSCGGCIATKHFLRREGVNFRQVDIEAAEREHEPHIEAARNRGEGLPVVIGPAGSFGGFQPAKLANLLDELHERGLPRRVVDNY